MKKLMNLLIVLGLAFGMVSCKCTSDNGNAEPNGELAELVVENTVSTDREYMFLHYSNDYRWYETCVLLKDFLDSEECDGTVEGVSNVFQVVYERGESAYDTYVILFAYSADGESSIEEKSGFWVGDLPLNEEVINLTYKDAYERLMEADCPKPHSRHCVLRKEVGPVDANPQYIFGNVHAQVYVDAVTGDVSEENPAFKGFGFKMPLGEWP